MKTRLLILALATCIITTPSMANIYGTAWVEYEGMIRGLSVPVTVYKSTTGSFVTMNQAAGLFQLDISQENYSGVSADSYLALGNEAAFCIDIFDAKPAPGSSDDLTYDVMSLDATPDPIATPLGGMGAYKAAFIAELLAENSFDTPQAAAAVQLAIWEIIAEPYDPADDVRHWDLSAGQFYTSNTSVGDDAEALLNSIGAGLPFDRYIGLSNGLNSTKELQDFVVVPVPAAVLLGFLGLGAAGLKLRRFV